MSRQPNKIKLAIVSERTRNHFHDPLKYFTRVEVYHLYQNTYSDFQPKDKQDLIHFSDSKDLYHKLNQIKPDIIQTFEPYYGFSKIKIPLRPLRLLLTVLKYSKKNNVPYYYNALAIVSPYLKFGPILGLVMDKFDTYFAKRALWIFTMTSPARNALITKGVPENKLINQMIGHWGVDTNIFKPTSKTTNPSVIFVGSLSERKGINYLLAIIPDLIQVMPGLEINIVGQGELYSVIKNKIPRENWQSVNLLGEVANHKIPELLARSWVVVSTAYDTKNWAEQTAGTLLEAMSCQTAIVGFKSGGIPDYVTSGHNGLLVAQKDTLALKGSILKVLTDPNLRQKFEKNNRNLISKKYSAEKSVTQLEDRILDHFSHKNS